jgi:hypothetical protein
VSGSRANFRSKDGGFLKDGVARSASSSEEFASQHIEFDITAGLRKLVTHGLKKSH